METCKICDREFKSIKSLAMHVKRTHSMESEDYFLKYIGSKGICKCGKETKFRNMATGYSKHCSSSCAYHDSLVSGKRESTMLDRYGSTTPMTSSIIKNKIKKTNNKKYGGDSPFNDPDIIKKAFNTIHERYDVNNIMQSETIKKKQKQTIHTIYGTDYAMQNKDVQEKARLTCMRNNGVSYPAQSPKIRDKQIKTSIDRYGFSVPSQSDEIRKKIIQTNNDRYGYDTPLKNIKVQEKSKNTCMKKYKVSHPGKIKSAHEKRHRTIKDKYKVDHLFQSPEIKDKINNTILEKYGVSNITKLDSVKEKIKQTTLSKYGVPYVFLTDNSIKKRHDTSINNMKLKYMNSLKSFNCEIIDTFYDNENKVKFKCNECNTVMTESWQFFVICRLTQNHTPCTICEPKRNGTSFMETDVYEFISSIHNNVKRNVRDIIHPRELDIYLPDINIAFEFNGLFYHSEAYKESNYHINKTNDCLNKGIQLIHIYEDDWLYHQDIVKSRIKNILGISNTIYARKCDIREVSVKDTNNFLDNNHMQGKCRSKYKYGLYYNDELVSIMTFGKSRFADEFELIRFCNKLNTSVVGGASRLFKHFIRNHDISSIISYADRSWSVGSLYENIGFVYHSTTTPGYSYVNGNVRESRMKYQKHKLVADGYDKNMTEHEIMLSRGMYQIYDSGNLKYIWNRD